MTGDPGRDDLDRLLEWMRDDHETDDLAADPGMPGGFPTPDTAHPALEPYAAGVRAWIEVRPLSPLRIPVIPSLPATWTRPDDHKPHTQPEVGSRTLYPSRIMAPAPFIGDPTQVEARYLWTAMTDDLGRTITGPATLAWRNL